MIKVTDQQVREAQDGELLIVERSANTPANPNRLPMGVYYRFKGATKSIFSFIQQSGSAAWGSITGTLSDQTDLQDALDAKLNNPNGTSSQFIKGDGSLDGTVYQPSLGFTPEDVANKSTSVVTDQASNTKYPSVKAVYDWAVGVFTTTAAVASQITTALVGYATESWVTTNFQAKLLFNPTQTIGIDFTANAVTGAATNAIFGSVLIPANTVTGNSLIEIESCIKVASPSGAASHRLFINTSVSVTGANQLAILTGTSTFIFYKLERTFWLTSTTINGYQSNLSANIDDVSGAATVTTHTVDWTVDQYILCVANNGTGTTTHQFTSVELKKV